MNLESKTGVQMTDPFIGFFVAANLMWKGQNQEFSPSFHLDPKFQNGNSNITSMFIRKTLSPV